MSFVRLRPATRSKGGTVTCRIEHNKDGSGVYRSKLFVLIAADVAAGRGWAPDDRIACEWGQGADHGLIRLVKDPEYAHAYRLRPPNGRNRSTLMLTVATLADWVPREHRKAQPCVTAAVKGGLIVTLPAEWWGGAADRPRQPISPTPSTPSAGAGKQASDLEEIPSSPAIPSRGLTGPAGPVDSAAPRTAKPGRSGGDVAGKAAHGRQPPNGIREGKTNTQPAVEVWPPFADGPDPGEVGIPAAVADVPAKPAPAKAPPAPPEPEPVAGEPDDATGPSWVLERHAGKVPLGRYWTGQILQLGLPETTIDLRKAMPWPSYPECAAALDTLIRNEHEPEMKNEFRKLKPSRPTLAEWREAAGRARAA